MAGHDTNKNEIYNQTLTLVKKPGPQIAAGCSRTDPLALELAKDMEHMRNLAYYIGAVQKHPAEFLLHIKGLVLETRDIKKSRGALFAHLVKLQHYSS